jgi:pentatricopeptide repeat protein
VAALSAKNVALALNSVTHFRGYDDFVARGKQRVLWLCQSGQRFHTQSLAMLVNSLVKRRAADPEVLSECARVAVQIPPSDYSPQAIAIILNGFSKSGRTDDAKELFAYLSYVATELPPQRWDAQGTALLLNSFARARVSDPTLFQAFSQIAQSLPLEAFSAQNIANIVNALGKMGFRDLALLSPT